MKIIAKKIVDDNYTVLTNSDEIKIDNTVVVGIDASTTTTGICIMDLESKKPLYSLSLHKDEDEKNIRYKVKFKRFLEEILEAQSNIKHTIYEEPHIQYINSAKVLLPLSTSVEEVVIENEPTFDYLDYKMYGNKVWKKQLLGDKLPVGTEKEKAAIALEVETMYPVYKAKTADGKCVFTQDEKDAFGLAYIRCRELLREIEFEKLPKQKPFKYEVEFIGADTLDEALEGISNVKFPKAVLENGSTLCTLQRGEIFDQKVYDNMAGEDKIVIVEFMPERAGNIVLRHKLHHLREYKYIYAVAWRKSRKKVIVKK